MITAAQTTAATCHGIASCFEGATAKPGRASGKLILAVACRSSRPLRSFIRTVHGLAGRPPGGPDCNSIWFLSGATVVAVGIWKGPADRPPRHCSDRP